MEPVGGYPLMPITWAFLNELLLGIREQISEDDVLDCKPHHEELPLGFPLEFLFTKGTPLESIGQLLQQWMSPAVLVPMPPRQTLPVPLRPKPTSSQTSLEPYGSAPADDWSKDLWTEDVSY